MSRLVTKIRWAVEFANNKLKTRCCFFLANVVTNNQVPLIGDYVRIVASLINAFRPPLYEKYPTDPTVAKRVLEKSKVEHPLTFIFKVYSLKIMKEELP